MIHHGGRHPRRLVREKRFVQVLLKAKRVIFQTQKRMRLPGMDHRIVEDSGEKWFEAGFRSGVELTGNATDGWTTSAVPGIRLRVEWSVDLVNWQFAKVTDAPGSPVDNGNGTWDFWSRGDHPVDSEIKTGTLIADSPSQPDSRNNPFTSIIIDGVALSLPNYPYEMPGDAAQLQTDLRAAGFDDATVVAASATSWTIQIPDVDLTSYNASNTVQWPPYTIPGPIGDQTLTGTSFRGTYLNSDGVETFMPRQFFRLKILPEP